jgi:hypothetical protein
MINIAKNRIVYYRKKGKLLQIGIRVPATPYKIFKKYNGTQYKPLASMKIQPSCKPIFTLHTIMISDTYVM